MKKKLIIIILLALFVGMSNVKALTEYWVNGINKVIIMLGLNITCIGSIYPQICGK